MKKTFFLITICAFLLTACGGKKIVGDWNVDRYEVNSQKGQSISTTNAGIIKIKKNGTGEKDIQYNMFQNDFSDIQEFRWNKPSEGLITITSTNSYKRSDFDKTWIIVEDGKKRQVWKSTDGSNTVQTLVLSKK